MTTWEKLPGNVPDFQEILEMNLARFRNLIEIYKAYSEIHKNFATKISGMSYL